MALTPKNIFDASAQEVTQIGDSDRILIGQPSSPSRIRFFKLAALKNALINTFQPFNARLGEFANLVQPNSPQNIRLKTNGSLELKPADYDQADEPTGVDKFNGAIWRERASNNLVIGVWQWSTSENVWKNFFLINSAPTRGSSGTTPPTQPIAQELAVYSVNTKLDSSGQSRRIALVQP